MKENALWVYFQRANTLLIKILIITIIISCGSSNMQSPQKVLVARGEKDKKLSKKSNTYGTEKEQKATNNFKFEKFGDGVEHWYIASNKKTNFSKVLESMCDNLSLSNNRIPFGQSYAFLIGVSKYDNILNQLPFVKNDVRDMKDFLLNKGGFDHVYVVMDENINRNLIEDYVRNKFPAWLNPNDRLLFYYAGHGADAGGQTGYMQFANAIPGNFAGPQVLAIKDVKYWSSEIKIQHLLFIFDCCASGLAFNYRSTSEPSHKRVISTLSGNGSRCVITAGTAEERTFEIEGNGIFTRAFLNAVESGEADRDKDGFMTINDIFSQLKNEVARHASIHGLSITPRLWELNPAKYRGTFVFINPLTKKMGIKINDNYSKILNDYRQPDYRQPDHQPTSGGDVLKLGTLKFLSPVSGQLIIDNSIERQINSNELMQVKLPVGGHRIKFLSDFFRPYEDYVEITERGLKVSFDSPDSSIFDSNNNGINYYEDIVTLPESENTINSMQEVKSELKKLKGYTIGIYVHKQHSDFQKIAKQIKNKLADIGFKGTVRIYKEDYGSFFWRMNPPKQFEIRYFIHTEVEQGKALTNILNYTFPEYEFKEFPVGDTPTPNFISIFLGPNP